MEGIVGYKENRGDNYDIRQESEEGNDGFRQVGRGWSFRKEGKVWL
jgi:hypothetical protein